MIAVGVVALVFWAVFWRLANGRTGTATTRTPPYVQANREHNKKCFKHPWLDW